MPMIRTRTALLAVALCATLAACSDDDDDAPESVTPTPDESLPGTDASGAALPDGVVRLEGGTLNAAEAVAELEAAIEANENLGLVALVDHEMNATGAGETLPPTRVALFGNPALGTPLMLASRTAGLDLPQRMLAFEGSASEEAVDDGTGDDEGAGDTEGQGDEGPGDEGSDEAAGLTLLWNDPAWIAARHGIEGEDEVLGTIAGALGMLGARAAGGEGEPVGDTDITTEANAGVMTTTSGRDFETTVSALRDAITGAGPLTLVEELDHAENATRAGLELPPTRLFVFGNPALGTPLMQAARSIGLDLPQKMLVWEEDDVVSIAWNDPAWLAERHGIEGREELLGRIAGALAGLAAAAAGTDTGTGGVSGGG